MLKIRVCNAPKRKIHLNRKTWKIFVKVMLRVTTTTGLPDFDEKSHVIQQ